MSKPVQFVFYREMYGAKETMGLVNGNEYHQEYHGTRMVDWTQPGLRITRLRLLTDPGYPMWDVSYCHGEIGIEKVRVQLPFNQLPKRRLLAAIVTHAKRDGVNAKRMGVFDAISKLE